MVITYDTGKVGKTLSEFQRYIYVYIFPFDEKVSCFDHKKEGYFFNQFLLVNQILMTSLERKITYFTAGLWSGHNLTRQHGHLKSTKDM